MPGSEAIDHATPEEVGDSGGSKEAGDPRDPSDGNEFSNGPDDNDGEGAIEASIKEIVARVKQAYGIESPPKNG